MKVTSLILGVSVLIATPLLTRADYFPELADNLGTAYFGSDRLSETEWDAQAFNSGSANHLVSLTLNLFRDPSASGTYWIKLYDKTGPGENPGSTPVATLATGRLISALGTTNAHTVNFDLGWVDVTPNTGYYIMVGTDPGSYGLRWGYTNDSTRGTGFPTTFSCTGDGGVTWRLKWTPLPQRMLLLGFRGWH